MQFVLWAMLTGGVTRGVWMAIVLMSRQRRLSAQYQALLERTEDRLSEMEQVHQRVMELEERLDSTERQLLQARHRIDRPGEPA